MRSPVKWVQDMLPIFKEPIMPGDFVQVDKLLMTYDDELYEDTIGPAYMGCNGQVMEMDTTVQPVLYLLHFGDHNEYWFQENELRRLA
jgi:hypothetical protein